MILKELKLINIRSYVRETVRFPDGSVLISGDIGSGKSTILLAVEFALFGIQRGQLSGETLLRNGSNAGTVELSFSLGKDDISIVRKLKRGKDGVAQGAGYILNNGSKFEGTPLELKAKVLELLGYPKSMITKGKSLIFRYTVYTPQDEMKRIISDDVETRLDTLRRVFNIDKYKRVKENSQILLRSIKQEKALLQGRAEGLDEKQHQLREREQEIKEANISSDALKPELESMQEKLNSVKEKKRSLEKEKEKRARTEQTLTQLERRLAEKVEEHRSLSGKATEARAITEELRTGLSRLGDKLAGKELNAIQKKLSELEEKKSSSEKELAAIRQKRQSLSEELRRIKHQMEPLVKESTEGLTLQHRLDGLIEQAEGMPKDAVDIPTLDSKEKELISGISIARQKAEDAAMLISDIEKLKECPTCRQEVDESHKAHIRKDNDAIIKSSKDTIGELEKQLDETVKRRKLHEEIREIGKSMDSFESSSKLLVSLKRRESELHEEDRLIAPKLVELEEEGLDERIAELRFLKDLHDELRVKKVEMEAASQTQEDIDSRQSSVKREIGSINEEKTKLSAEMKGLEDVNDQLINIEEEERALREKERDISMKRAGLGQKLADLKMQSEDLREEIEEKKRHKESITLLSNRQGWIEELFVKLVGLIERQVMASVHKEFDELFSGWFDMLMQDETLQAKLDDRFTPVVVQNGYETDIGNLSGGERTSLALAYRLALNRVINDLISDIKTKDIIILDEPTDGFSSQQLDNVRNVLDELPNKQIIIVSHEPKVESFVQNIITVSKHEHVSSVS